MSQPAGRPRVGLGAAMVLRFGPADVGRRVTLRRRLPETDPRAPGLGDVVGVLESWQDGVLTLRKRKGELVEVPASSVVAGRVVAPELSAAALSEVADDTWRPHESARLGEWRLRAHGGVTHRPNAALAVGEPGRSLPDALDAVRAWYAERDLPAAVMTPLPAPVAEAAASLGWRQERRTVVIAAAVPELAEQPAPLPDGVRLDLTTDLPDDWDAVLPRLADPGQRDLYRELLTGTPGAAFATARDETSGAPLGVARGAVSAGWTNLTNVEVVPSARRQGLGAALPVALARWAQGQGATHVFLQAWPDNDVALRLYSRLGFTKHHEYAYLVAP